MLDNNQLIEVKYVPIKAKHFRALGYTFNSGDIIKVHAYELMPHSHERVKGFCDKCGAEICCEYRQYLDRIKKHNGKYLCQKCASGDIDIINKRKSTCINKYGCQNPMQDLDIAIKNRSSYGDKVPTSKAQIKLYDLLKQHYNKCEINYQEGPFSLDVYLHINDCKIDVEYDGMYWHQDKSKDKRRDVYLNSLGYKVLRIKANREIPDEDIIIQTITNLINSTTYYDEIHYNK